MTNKNETTKGNFDMKTANVGNTVKIEVQGRDLDGSVAIHETEAEFKIGENQVITGLEEAVAGMKEGELKTTTIPANRAFGTYDQAKTVVVKRDQLPRNMDPKPGTEFPLDDAKGSKLMARITEVTPSTVVIDCNHPLAGKDLQFEIRLLNVS